MSELKCLSIAGFDPSAGAGILADIKTFEFHKVEACGVCTAITFQNDIEFENAQWLSIDSIINQLKILNKRFHFPYIKIGLVENILVLEDLIDYLKNKNPAVKIIWDPILKSSSGFVFHKTINAQKFEKILKNIYLITPNYHEITKLRLGNNPHESAKELNRFCNVLLKGGHSPDKELATDILFTDSREIPFPAKKLSHSEKHGSGCVLSSSITANLSKGLNLEDACREAKKYTLNFLKSDEGLLGKHYAS
jgi:hydroxymethylpyrimidine/phosphomethylpyrimidine kinase